MDQVLNSGFGIDHTVPMRKELSRAQIVLYTGDKPWRSATLSMPLVMRKQGDE